MSKKEKKKVQSRKRIKERVQSRKMKRGRECNLVSGERWSAISVVKLKNTSVTDY